METVTRENRLFAKEIGIIKTWCRMWSTPESIRHSLDRIFRHLEAEQQRDYLCCPLEQRSRHLYRDLRKVRAWSARTMPQNCKFNVPTILPTLGRIVISNCQGWFDGPRIQQLLASD